VNRHDGKKGYEPGRQQAVVGSSLPSVQSTTAQAPTDWNPEFCFQQHTHPNDTSIGSVLQFWSVTCQIPNEPEPVRSHIHSLCLTFLHKCILYSGKLLLPSYYHVHQLMETDLCHFKCLNALPYTTIYTKTWHLLFFNAVLFLIFATLALMLRNKIT